MNIIEKTYNWNGGLVNRSKTNYIVIHHMAGFGSADDIHHIHCGNGWAGIGYHFFVRTDGTVYRGRPINKVGAHTVNYNSVSVGICFEGNFETTAGMPDAQKQAGKELVSYLKNLYPNAKVKKHKDFQATACPGKYFPFDEIANGSDVAQSATSLKPTTNKGVETVQITMPILRKGSKGNEVKTLQRLLIALGHSCGDSGVDGDFGNATHNAVKSFQKVAFISDKDVDGIVGANTWNKLLK